ncbi:MAG TPA: response regulator transcription factor, partial [Terriglobales bacterium]|nr:response regulator transcription factor [Terriglobales bacterium]
MSQPAKILLAEDQADLREMIAVTLRMAGHDVLAAPDGGAALQAAQASSPDLIIMDIHMPVLDGLQVCEQLREVEALSKVPVMLMSSLPIDQAQVTGEQVGANEYLRKPFELSHLIQRVDALLR